MTLRRCVLAVVLTASTPALAQEPPAPTDKTDEPLDVRVEGDRGAPPRAARAPEVASYVVRGEALKRPGAAAVDVLAASPGVESARTGAGSDLATVSIRGAPSAELPVYLAGIRLNDDLTGGADLSTVPLFALDRVEIFRGNAPPDADRLGIGGAVFFEPRLPRGTHAGASFGAGSFGELSFGAYGSLGDERAGALFSLVRQSATNDFSYTDDHDSPLDPRDDSLVQRRNGDATTYDAWALGRVALPGGGRLVLLANTFAREQGVIGVTNPPARSARSATQREMAAASVRLPCAGTTPEEAAIERCSIDLSSSALVTRRTISDRGERGQESELGLPATLVAISGARWQETARLRARIGERVQVGGGVFTGIDRLDIDLSGLAQTRAARLSVTASADLRWDVTERVALFALGAGECHTPFGGEAPGRACAAGGPAGRVGARIALPLSIELVLSGGSYVRVPTLGELYGLSATVRGNPKLESERGIAAEIGARRSFASAGGEVRGYLDATAFIRFAEDLIAYRRSSLGAIKPFNVADARVLGVEALAGFDIARHLRGEVSLTALDPRDVTPDRLVKNTLLPYHAPLSLTSLLEAYAAPGGSLRFVERVAVAARFRYRAARYADDAARIYLAEVRNLALDAGVRLFRGRLAARFSITNVLDVIDEDLLGFALPGRAYHGSLEATW